MSAADSKELRVIRSERRKLWRRYGSFVREGYSALPAEVLKGIRVLTEREATILARNKSA